MRVKFKILTFPCQFQGGLQQIINFYVGLPTPDSHPIGFQMKWLGGKGGNVPSDISNALERIKKIAISHNIPFVELCDYVIANLNKNK